MDYRDNSNFGYDDRDSEYNMQKTLPFSEQSDLSFNQLLKINQLYLKQLTKILDGNSYYKNAVTLPGNDMKVLNNLLKENYIYLNSIIRENTFRNEFNNLFSVSMNILNSLSQFSQNRLSVYVKLEKLKFLELKYHFLRISGTDLDYSEAEFVLDEIEKLHYDNSLSSYLTLLEYSSVKFYRALIKFYLGDIDLSEDYAKSALEILNKKNPLREEKNLSKRSQNSSRKFDNNDDKYLKKIAEIHEFLAELYDLKKDYKNALSCYEKCYFLYLGRYGINHPLVIPFKNKKEQYDEKIMDIEREKTLTEKESYINQNLMGGKIFNSKGTTNTFSFKIPVTQNVEPMIISIYALSENENLDRFSSKLFLRSIYLSKEKLYKFLGISNSMSKDNCFLYSDEALNLILQNITVTDNKFIHFIDPVLYDAFINC